MNSPQPSVRLPDNCGSSENSDGKSNLDSDLALIERVVCEFPGVGFAAARIVPDISGDSHAMVWFEAVGGADVDLRDLRRFLMERLPRSAVPSRIVPVAALSRATDGTVDAEQLVVPSWISASVHSLRLLPDPTENRLTDLWSVLLGRTDIEVDEDFFELGGTSVDALRLLAICADQFGVEVSLASFFVQPTIERLAELIKADTASHSCMLTVGSSGTKRPFFCVYPGTGLQGLRLLARVEPDRPFVTITPHGFGVSAPRVDSLADLAAHYVSEIRQMQPHGPYHLGGHCASVIVAYEVADLLTRQGETVTTFVGVKPAVRVNLERLGGADFFVLDELFGGAAADSAVADVSALLDDELANLRSPNSQAEAIARMRPAMASLYSELMRMSSMPPDYGFDQFMALIESWAWYLTAAARHVLSPASFPIDVVSPRSDNTALITDWQAVTGRAPAIHRIDNIEPFETPAFAGWLAALLDERDREN